MIKLQKLLTIFDRTATLSLRNVFISTIISALQFLKMFWKTTYFYVKFEEKHGVKLDRKRCSDSSKWCFRGSKFENFPWGGTTPDPPNNTIIIISLQLLNFPLDPPPYKSMDFFKYLPLCTFYQQNSKQLLDLS